ncbi:UU173 family protein [Mycoplasma hafezii]|uniref:UU173 family protein n=1 Tax=Mycoplasma hafezii TaxID=525886 RepID=UPI003CEE8179
MSQQPNNNEIVVSWSNFKKIFDKNPTLIYRNAEELKKELQRLWDNISQEKIIIDETDSDDDFNDEEIDENTIKKMIQTTETKIMEDVMNFDEFNNKTSHLFDWFEFSDNEKTTPIELNEQYVLIKGNSFNQYKAKAIDFYINKYSYKPEQVKYISVRNNAAEKVELTKKLLSDDSVDLIVNPTFAVNHIFNNKEYKFIVSASLYDKKLQKFTDISFKSFASIIDNQKCLYLYLCLKELGENLVNFQDYSVIIIDPLLKITKNFKKGEISFYESFGSNYRTEAINPSKVKELEEVKIQKLLNDTGLINLLEIGDFSSWKKSKFSFYNSVKYNNQISYKTSNPILKQSWNLSRFKSMDDFINQFNEPSAFIFKSVEYSDFYKKLDDYLIVLDKAWEEFGTDKNISQEQLKYFFLSNGNKVTEIPNGDKKPKVFKEPLIDLLYQKWFEFNQLNYEYENQIKTRDANAAFMSNSNKYYAGLNIPKWIQKDVELKTLLINVLLAHDFERLSGKYYQGREIYDYGFVKLKNDLFYKTQDFFNFNVANLIKRLHIKNARICWYDYEGFSDLFPVLDYVNPYNQVVNQVSIIITQNGKELSCENIVKDTQTLSLKDLCEMIEAIYADKADYFVVFNKSYENTRNKEILELVINTVNANKDIEFLNWFFNRFDTVENFANMINHINDNTVDLADSFMIVDLSKNKYAAFNTSTADTYSSFRVENHKILKEENADNFIAKNIATFGRMMISIKYLKYFYSIKKIEKYITHYEIDLKNKIVPYTSLKEVQKGTDAMEKAIQRYLGSIGDNLWNNLFVPNLKKYCENDVRAMLMVYDFVMEILKSAYPEIEDYQYELVDENQRYELKEGKLIVI